MKTMYERILKNKANKKPNIRNHYTPREIVIKCISKIPYRKEDLCLDVGSGENMVWYNNLNCKRDWVEIDKGKDFFNYNNKVDWCIGNPPYKDFWKFMSKSLDISKKGIAFLVQADFWNRLTQKRLKEMENKGFFMSRIYVLEVKEWFGRYFFIIITKKNKGFLERLQKQNSEEKS